MEESGPLTRKRRKRAHPTKCPCCSEDGGKPEKQARRRREDIDVEPSSATAGDDRSTSPKRTQVANSKLIKIENESGSETGEENSINKGRVLRSGQSTPVPFEKEKMTCQLKKANSNEVDKRRDFPAQKGSRKPKKATGNRDAEKKRGKRSLVQDSDNVKPTSKKSDNFVDSAKSKVDSAKSKVSKMQKSTKGASESIKVESQPRQSIKKSLKRKHVKLPPMHRQSMVKKVLAIDKLKIRTFDNLKEKLEIAVEQTSLTVPECVELCQKITPRDLKDILECEMSVMKGSSFEEMKLGDLTDEVTESGSEAKAMDKKFAENMNASEAAKALVSFKVQTTAVSSASNQSQTSFQELKNSLSSQESTVSSTNPLKSVDTLTATSTGLTGFPSNQPLKTTGVQGMTSIVLPTAAMSNISMVQAPMAFQLLQVQSQGTKSGELQATPIQQTPSFIYQNPSAMMNKLTSVNQQANGLFPSTLNQLLYLSNLKQQHEGKSLLNPNVCGFLPSAMQTQDQAIFSSASGPITCTSLANTTVSTLCPASTSITEIQSSTKLRPILPREPLVVPNFQASFAGHGLKQSTSTNTFPNIATQSSNIHVKQEIKRLVSERTKANNPSTPEVTMSLPDIASTFIIKTEFHQSEVPLAAKSQQEVTEMTNKEQAINALLSIGGNESLSQLRNGETDGFGNRSTNDLKVVFDTDKGIFKVDDVTIDPLVNTISKESYTCGKCGKIFTSLSYLARHIKRVCPDMSHRKWKCSHCEKAFRHPFGLQQHIYTHTGERPHKCPQCPKAFYSSNDLRRHSRIHSGERPYKCKHCGKSFATTISLKTHTFIHTGEKPHRCPHCVKTFATSSKLGRHIVTHSEQRPYSCNQCPKTFNRSGDLRRHNLHVHNEKLTENPTGVVVKQEEKIYGCTECSGVFDTAKELEAHINEHTTA